MQGIAMDGGPSMAAEAANWFSQKFQLQVSQKNRSTSLTVCPRSNELVVAYACRADFRKAPFSSGSEDAHHWDVRLPAILRCSLLKCFLSLSCAVCHWQKCVA